MRWREISAAGNHGVRHGLPLVDPVTGITYHGLAEPDWHLMDPLTGEDVSEFWKLSAACAARDLREDREEK